MTANQQRLLQTPLHDLHVQLGAKMAPFAGFDMPIQYSSIIKEHEAARTAAVIFDTCHMGEFYISGTTALADLERVLTAKVASLPIGKCRYSFMCNERGGAIDDLLIYRLAEDRFMLVVNASRRAQDLVWLQDHSSPQTEVHDASDRIAKIDLQGPGSPRIMQALTGQSISGMTFYSFMQNTYCKEEVLISRTGYTGEVGFELYCSAETARKFWTDCLEANAVAAGLGARDTLRLEMGMPLYGHELNEDRNVGETCFTKAVSDDKNFIGADNVLSDHGLQQRLVGIRFAGRRAAREGADVLDAEEHVVGHVTSGSFAPSLGHAVALAYVNPWYATPGTPVQVAAGKTLLHGTIAGLPFYKDGTARLKLLRFLNHAFGMKRREKENGNTTRSQVYEVA